MGELPTGLFYPPSDRFSQILEGGGSAPEQHADMTFGYMFNLTLGDRFSQRLEGVALPSSWRT